jgi:transposase
MICLVLSPEETAQLEQARRTRPEIAERCHDVLLNAEGWSAPYIAQRLDRHAHTIRTWLEAYQTSGLPGLRNTLQPGRPATKGQIVTAQLEHLLPRVPATAALLRTAGRSTSSVIISHSTQATSVTRPCAARCRRVAGSLSTRTSLCCHCALAACTLGARPSWPLSEQARRRRSQGKPYKNFCPGPCSRGEVELRAFFRQATPAML